MSTRLETFPLSGTLYTVALIKIIMDKKACRILKKVLRTGSIDLGDAMDTMTLLADKRKQALDQPKQVTIYNNKGKLKRKSFPPQIQELTLIKQAYICNICKERLDVTNFDHIDGNRSNNSIANCEALCPNCHAKKTRK